MIYLLLAIVALLIALLLTVFMVTIGFQLGGAGGVVVMIIAIVWIVISDFGKTNIINKK